MGNSLGGYCIMQQKRDGGKDIRKLVQGAIGQEGYKVISDDLAEQ